MTETRRLLSAAKAAERLNVSVRTVHRMAADGRLPVAAKLDGDTGSWVFDADDVDEASYTRKANA